MLMGLRLGGSGCRWYLKDEVRTHLKHFTGKPGDGGSGRKTAGLVGMVGSGFKGLGTCRCMTWS